MTAAAPIGLFAGYGIELEWMIVDRASLDVRPYSDRVLLENGRVESEVERGELAWSNELAAHLIELKTNGPVPALEGLPAHFRAHARRIDALLLPHGARLMPSAMHPWMDPWTETRIWSHEYDEVYAAFDRIFDCRGHGWSNLQSQHLNLPFASDEEFGRLHAAIRLLLPILPALAASSPFVEGRATETHDNRLRFYRTNSARVPELSGILVPEPVFARADYEREILAKIHAAMAPHDPEGVLREEWCNARGAIARFDRSAIEIRILDAQECAEADLAISALVSAVLQALIDQRFASGARQRAWDTERLARILFAVVERSDETVIGDTDYLRDLGFEGAQRASAGELWSHLMDATLPSDSPWRPALATILAKGSLARRLLRASGPRPTRDRLHETYEELCDCLVEGRLFDA